MDINAELLVEAALRARKKAYAPYSGFAVGAALLGASGRVYTGCNVESASYPATLCAERAAFAKAVGDGERRFLAIAVAGAPAAELPSRACPPCGICRQVMAEFCDPEAFEILLADSPHSFARYTLEALLPMAFGPKSL